jgi:hypothetical protein
MEQIRKNSVDYSGQSKDVRDSEDLELEIYIVLSKLWSTLVNQQKESLQKESGLRYKVNKP